MHSLFQTRQSLFSINIGNGIIELSDHLDYETETSYQLEVMAVVRIIANKHIYIYIYKQSMTCSSIYCPRHLP